MQDTWLFGQSLKKNRAKCLPVHSTKCGLDGVDDRIIVDNSGNVGNPFDWETTTPFTWCLQFTFSSIKDNQYFLYKVGSTGGFNARYLKSGSLFVVEYIHTSGALNFGSQLFFVPTVNTPYIAVFTNTGTNFPNTSGSIGIYNGITGAVIASTYSALGTPYAGSVKNTNPLYFGIFSHMIVSKISIWNAFLVNATETELVSKTINNTLETHSLYNANCTGYWKDFSGQAINKKNNLYNGTYSGFTNP